MRAHKSEARHRQCNHDKGLFARAMKIFDKEGPLSHGFEKIADEQALHRCRHPHTRDGFPRFEYAKLRATYKLKTRFKR